VSPSRLQKVKYVRLLGGLGNNLFQIALAYRIVQEFDSRVDFFRITRSRLFEKSSVSWDFRQNQIDSQLLIEGFGLFGRVSSNFAYGRFHESLITPGGRLRNNLSLSRLKTNSNQNDTCWYPSEQDFETINVFSGYFQNAELINGLSESFFQTLVRILESMSNQTYLRIANDYDACIQVRRGDYRYHKGSIGLLSDAFFIESLQTLGIDPKSSRVLLVTDDPSACSSLIKKIPKARILGPTEAGAITALLILASSKHLVISNSTLAWWGGILARKFGAKVLAPNPWRIQSCDVHGPNKILDGADFYLGRATFDD
jgi:Glycosyl transferase family 11